MERDSFLYKARRRTQVVAYHILPHKTLSKIYYRIVLHKKLDLKHPQTLNEKLQWLKLYHYPDNPLVVQCTDKYAVREYVKEKGMGDKLPQLLGVWDDSTDIDWDILPDQFVMKCTHGCDYNLICKDKENLDKGFSTARLDKWLKQNFAAFNVELHYSKIKQRKIIAEEFLGDDIADYKFFCLNGKIQFLYVATDLYHGKHLNMGYYGENGEKLAVHRNGYQDTEMVTMPDFFGEMKKSAEILAKDFIFVRVDFFANQESYWFSELTFTPAGCMMGLDPPKYDRIWGELLDISEAYT